MAKEILRTDYIMNINFNCDVSINTFICLIQPHFKIIIGISNLIRIFEHSYRDCITI